MDARVWTITIAAPCEWVTANRVYGRYNNMVRARLIREWRTAAWRMARQARLPQGMDRVRIDAVAHFPAGLPAPVRDRDNLRPTLKAVIDGLGPELSYWRGRPPRRTLVVAKGWGLIPDDNDAHLAASDIHIGDPLPAGRLAVTITEVTTAGPAARPRRVKAGHGLCTECGHEVRINPAGLIRTHKQHRIDPAGAPYATGASCSGGGKPPVALELVP